MKLPCLCVVLAGCATAGFEVVPDSDWHTVPQAQRDPLDHSFDVELARAQHDVQLATAALADAQRAVQPRPVMHRAPVPNADAELTAALRDHEQLKTEALGRVDAAKISWSHANLEWRKQRLAAAVAQVAVVQSEHEVQRARAIDQRLTGDDTYDVTKFRGQLAHAQETAYAASSRAAAARIALERASAEVASQKEAFAQLVRNGPPTLEAASTKMRLGGWMASSDGTKRRGLKLVSTPQSYLHLLK